MVCTFFGHREVSESILPVLRAVLEHLIEEEGATRFYVGHQGAFDRMVAGELARLHIIYPHICWMIVLAYLPTETNSTDAPTIYPEGLEYIPPRFAINKRNDWMINASEIVITYTVTTHGGAACWKEKARKKGKRIVELNGL